MSQPHPEIQKFVQAFEDAMHGDGLTDLHSGGVAAARVFNDSRKMPDDMLPPIYQVEDSAISSETGEIPIRIYRPNDDRVVAVADVVSRRGMGAGRSGYGRV